MEHTTRNAQRAFALILTQSGNLPLAFCDDESGALLAESKWEMAYLDFALCDHLHNIRDGLSIRLPKMHLVPAAQSSRIREMLVKHIPGGCSSGCACLKIPRS
jgi:hypothetical protein